MHKDAWRMSILLSFYQPTPNYDACKNEDSENTSVASRTNGLQCYAFIAKVAISTSKVVMVLS